MGEFGAGLLGGILPLAGILIAAFATDKAAKRLPRNKHGETGCIPQLLIFTCICAILYFLFAPAVHVLKSYGCRGASDYNECMDPEPIEDWM